MSWLRAEPEPNEAGLIGFRKDLLLLLAAFAFAAAWLLMLAALAADRTLLAGVGLGWLTLAVSAAMFVLRRRWPHRAALLSVFAGLSLVGAAYVVLGHPAVLAVLALVVLASGLLLDTAYLVLAGTAATILTLRLAPPDTVPYLLVLQAAAAGLAAVTRRGLHLMDFWEHEVSVVQEQTILQLREGQGELARTVKALHAANDLLKRALDELAAARRQADEARLLKEHFAANVSHELRVPLNLIVGFAELMYLMPESYKGVRWTRDLEGDVRELYRASRHLQSLVNDILDLSRIDAARLPMFREISDLHTLVADAIDTVAPLLRQRRLRVTVECPEALPRLFIDRTRIRQVLLNLLNNAVRHTHEGGITVRVSCGPGHVEVSVADTGAGIPADQLGRIFEEFHQADGGRGLREGSGLGLALSRRFVTLHGGELWAESVVGAGSTFRFTLPLPGATVGEETFEPSRARGAPVEEARRTVSPVVVVDPDPGVADMLRRYLEDRLVLGVETPEAAEALIEREHPQAVIVNQLPDVPPEGWIGSIGERSARYNVPVVRCSLPSLGWLSRPAALDGCLNKPVSTETLSRLLAAHDGPLRRILVVDDDPGFVRLIVRLLKSLRRGVEVLKAISGAQALRLAREHQPDLVLLELLMAPMDGFELARRMRADPALSGVRIVAVTATSYEEEVFRRHGGHLTLSQAANLPAGSLIELLVALLGVVRPDYVAVEKNPSSVASRAALSTGLPRNASAPSALASSGS